MQIQLEGSEGFIKLRPRDKRPVEKWREQYSLDKLTDWEGNIGFACGTNDIVVLDIDNPVRCQELGIEFDEDSYIVKTGSGGFHLYFYSPGATKVIIHDKEANHIGELQCMGQYVVCAGSIHPNGNTYKLLTPDAAIPTATPEEILNRFRGKCKMSDEVPKPSYTWKDVSERRSDDPFAGVRVNDVFDMHVREESNGQILGPHPVHGSSTGHNLIIHEGKNAWQCRRCMSGGGPALAVAVMYGIIDCSDARAGALRGDKFKQVLEVAREKGIIKEPESLYSFTKKELEIDDDN
jgi:hypothetical protein